MCLASCGIVVKTFQLNPQKIILNRRTAITCCAISRPVIVYHKQLAKKISVLEHCHRTVHMMGRELNEHCY